jgi:hypothetical protein
MQGVGWRRQGANILTQAGPCRSGC